MWCGGYPCRVADRPRAHDLLVELSHPRYPHDCSLEEGQERSVTLAERAGASCVTTKSNFP